MRFLELMDEISLAENKMEAPAYHIEREGVVKGSNITLHFLDKIGDKIFAVCKVDDLTTNLLLTAENRLPVGFMRRNIATEEDFNFLFENTEGKDADWKFSAELFDNSYEGGAITYKLANQFCEVYTETPKRELFEGSLEVKFALYFAESVKRDNVDGIAVIEIGNDLRSRGGFITYYNFREIPETDVNYL